MPTEEYQSIKNSVRVSVCVPVYGVEDYIERCARSLFEQTYDAIEYVFVDDCAIDNSISILKRVLNDYPNRIGSVRIIRHRRNSGLAVARNTCVNSASGDYIIHVDSDDWLEKNTVEECVKSVSKTNYDIVYFDIISHWEGYNDILNIPLGVTKDKLLEEMLSYRVRHCLCGSFIKRSLYVENNIHALDGINMAEDFQVSPLLLYYAKSIFSIGKVLYHYNRTKDVSYTSTFSEEKTEQEWMSILHVENFFKNYSPNYLENIERYKILSIFQNISNCCMVGGHSKYYGETILKRKMKVNRIYWKDVPILKRIVLYINNETVIRYYLRLMITLNVVIKKMI